MCLVPSWLPVDSREMKRTSAIFGILLLCLALPVMAAEKVTICHFGSHFVTLTISESAVYGNGGHFNENGTPQSGHELDYMGPCVDETTTTTAAEVTTTSVDEVTTTAPVTTTTAAEVTTTTEAENQDEGTTTTTLAEVTTTTAAEVTTTTQGSEETTTTTAPEEVTTTTAAPEVTTTTLFESQEQATTTTAAEAVTTTTAAPEVTTTTQGAEQSTTTTSEGLPVDLSVGAGPTVAVEDPAQDSVVAGLTVTEAGQAAANTEAATVAATVVSPITVLPFTGMNAALLAGIALALALGGTLTLKSSTIEVNPKVVEGAYRPRHLS